MECILVTHARTAHTHTHALYDCLTLKHVADICPGEAPLPVSVCKMVTKCTAISRLSILR